MYSIKLVSKRKTSTKTIIVLTVSFILTISLGYVCWRYYQNYITDSDLTSRNHNIVNALRNHSVQYLVAENNRVESLRPFVPAQQYLVPLSTCAQPALVDFQSSSFAYVFTNDQLISHRPSCSLSEFEKIYGNPNANILIAGTLDKQTEVLLIYDKSVSQNLHPDSKNIRLPGVDSPIALSQLPKNADCSGRTILNFVAHQDDDLLFLSPDVLDDLKAEKCVRTVYVTAGDAGIDKYFWLSREQGSQHAYSYMTSENDEVWNQRTIKLASNEFITLDTPQNNPQISLIFMHLPDGNFDGSGFKTTKNASIAKLNAGKIKSIASIDAQSSYTSSDLKAALTAMIKYYNPAIIRSQSAQRVLKGNAYIDHSDHITVGAYVEQAYQQAYGTSIAVPLYVYNGYTIHGMMHNLTMEAAQAKEQAFLQYARYDGSVCQSIADCERTATYGSYIQRQYKSSY